MNSSSHKTCSLLILNWNGAGLLKECLPSVLDAVAFAGGEHEILVIDNGSTDGSVAFMQENFPQVRVVALDRNYSFIGGYNRGVQEARNDILVFLNNDMAVDKNFLRPLLDGFTDEQVFAVSSQIFFTDPGKRREETGKTRAVWSMGAIAYVHDAPTAEDDKLGYVPAFWAGGGSAAFDRRKFLELGGFDPLLNPLYMEDVDLSYLAWKRGWKVLFCPASKVYHKHRASSGRLDRAYLERIIHRNRLLFIWKNITDPGMLLQHLLSLPALPWHPAWGLGARETARVLWMALGRLPEALRSRRRAHRHARLHDKEVFLVANDPLFFKERFISCRWLSVRINWYMRIPPPCSSEGK